MDIFTRDDLKALLEEHQAPCVSLYLPVGADFQGAPIRLRNHLRNAEERLIKAGLKLAEARALLQPIEALLSDAPFWREPSHAALFRSLDFFKVYRLPNLVPELLAIGSRFTIRPILPVLSGEGHFYVLALSQKHVRLLRCTRETSQPVDVAGIPASMAEAEAQAGEVIEKDLQFRVGTPSAGRRHSGAGIGYASGPEQSDKERIARFFHAVDHGLADVLRGERDPLVLAAVDYLHPLYRQSSSYGHLLGEGLIGSPDAVRDDDLRVRAWALVEPIFRKAQGDALARFEQMAGKASSELEEIVPAACYGRVDTLFVAADAPAWGHFDEASGQVTVNGSQESGEDLLDRAVVDTLLHDGAVYPLPLAEMPRHAPAAAVFRY